ncbi:MAG: acetyl-CoA carboxylase biotin carboxyl carrier protein subunit [Clostridiales Family XIII bacterium]|jgi:biotin carboxyl carrier protein|nr:acetyl-CoA carboxylase biotin carboxyl carrier protein subunit [Clostridiales Family XIII bacterium]
MRYEVKAPMPAKVLAFNVKPGDAVTDDTVVATVESMKMELPIYAGASGTVSEIVAAPNALLNQDDLVLIIE